METNAKNAGSVIVERTFEAAISKIWEALTNVKQMQQWYFDIAEFKPEVGFEFEFNGGNEDMVYVHKCRVTQAIAPAKLAYTWCYENYPGNSLVTFELFEEGEHTRLKLTHTGLETFPDHPDFASSSFNAGWHYIVNISLKSFVEGDQ